MVKVICRKTTIGVKDTTFFFLLYSSFVMAGYAKACGTCYSEYNVTNTKLQLQC